MYQRRRSSTFGNLNDLLNGIATGSEAANADVGGAQASPTRNSTTSTKRTAGSSPSNSPVPLLRRRPTTSALLGGGASESARLGSSSVSVTSNAGPGATATTINGIRQRTRHSSVTHVHSSDLFERQHSRQRSVSPDGKAAGLSPGSVGGSNSRQMSVSAENFAELALDDNQIALLRAESQAIATRGEVKLAIVYLQEEKTLKVTVYKAENLGKNRRDISSFVSACLLPGKEQKQQSRLFKSNKNPQFNVSVWIDGTRGRAENC